MRPYIESKLCIIDGMIEVFQATYTKFDGGSAKSNLVYIQVNTTIMSSSLYAPGVIFQHDIDRLNTTKNINILHTSMAV